MWNTLPPEYRLAIYERHHTELLHEAEMTRLVRQDSRATRLRAWLGRVLVAAGHALEPSQAASGTPCPEARAR